jgi:hypothetical protein
MTAVKTSIKCLVRRGEGRLCLYNFLLLHGMQMADNLDMWRGDI